MRNYLILIFLFKSAFLQGQNRNEFPDRCGSISKGLAKIISNENMQHFLRTTSISEPYLVKVYCTIFSDNDGTNAATNEDTIVKRFQSMVNFYSSRNICFALVGIRYIQNSDYNVQDADNEESEMYDLRIPNCLNVFFHNELFVSSGNIGGIAYGIPNTDAFISIKAGSFNNPNYPSLMPHEIGHVFGLYHTFETHPGDPLHGKENVDRTGPCSDCSLDGDLLCDTPADPDLSTTDPYLKNNTDNNCQYIGNRVDDCGVLYTPDTRNIMSYGQVTCLRFFSVNQGQRMRYYISTEAGLQNVMAQNEEVNFLPATYSSGTGWGVARDLYQFLPSIGPIVYNGSANYFFIANKIIVSPGNSVVRFSPSTGGKIVLKQNQYCN